MDEREEEGRDGEGESREGENARGGPELNLICSNSTGQQEGETRKVFDDEGGLP